MSSAQSELSAGLAQPWALQVQWGLHFDFLLFLSGLLLLLAQLLGAGGAISAGKCSMSVPLSQPREHQHGTHGPPNTGNVGLSPHLWPLLLTGHSQSTGKMWVVGQRNRLEKISRF